MSVRRTRMPKGDTGAAGASGNNDLYLVWPGEKAPASPNAKDDEFDDASLDGKWSAIGSGSFTESLGYGMLTPTQQNAHALCGLEQTAPAGDFTLSARIAAVPPMVGAAVSIGLYVKNSSNGKIVSWGGFGTAGPVANTNLMRWTNLTTFSAIVASDYAPLRHNYLRIVLATTTMTFWYSDDGLGWTQAQAFSETIAAFLGTVRGDLDRIGFMANANNGGATIQTMNVPIYWFRVT